MALYKNSLDFKNAYFCCWNQHIWGGGWTTFGCLCPTRPQCRTAPAATTTTAAATATAAAAAAAATTTTTTSSSSSSTTTTTYVQIIVLPITIVAGALYKVYI